MSVVPQNLSDLKTSDSAKFSRYEELSRAFQEKFKKEPEFICCAPGRVNLIGEHIDYCGYSVLPMAVSQDISIAVAKTDDQSLRLSNTEHFSDFSGDVNSYTIDSTKPEWFHYILCGLKGVCEYSSCTSPTGMEIMVNGTVPKAAGMSSSSALVCAAALTTAVCNKLEISRHNLADLCAKCERYIGTQGGGMDQSISFLAEKGTAKLISFNPLRSEDVNIPQGAVFVITNSCVKMEKAATSHFNRRVAECKIATQILAKRKGLDGSNIKKFLDLQTSLKASFAEMLKIVDEVLHPSPYKRSEICKILEITDEELKDKLLSNNTQDVETFRLHERAKHVFSEAHRVLQFQSTCNKKQEPGQLEMLGRLMNQSHESCSKLYECSCPQLDELTELCRQSGALGSRLTGAGLGGCAVSLVPENLVPAFLEKVRAGFYQEISPDQLGNIMFASQPGGGAQVYIL